MSLYVSESFIDVSQGCRFGDSEPYDTGLDNMGKLFRNLQREYGRCVSKMYIDTKDGRTRAIGWVFLKRVQYGDSHESYLREVWVSLHDKEPETKVTYHYHELGV